MTPFQEFRLWARRAPVGQRVAAAVAALVALSALGWMLVPASAQSAPSAQSSSGQNQTGGAGAASTTTTAAGGASATGGPTQPAGGASGVGTGGAAGSTAGASGAVTAGRTATGATAASPGAATGGATAASHCVSPPGSAPGVTSTTINIAVLLVDIAGAAGNQEFGIPAPATQQAGYETMINSINASGGVACRKVVPQFFQGNPADSSSLQQVCLQVAQAGVFAVIDFGAFANYPNVSCFPQNHIPYFGGNELPESTVSQFYPYIFDIGNFDAIYKDTVFGLQKGGYFTAAQGFSKLGIIYRDCYPQIVSEEMGWLNQAGVPSADIVSYDVGCPSAFASPSDIENAILKFQQAGVTNVTTIDELGDFANFTTVAQSQGFHPKYDLADDGLLQIGGGTEAPNASNIAGAIAITSGREGEQNTPGLTPSPGTVKCNAIAQAAGGAPAWQAGSSGLGVACDQLWMFEDAVDHAPALAQDALGAGLDSTGPVDLSFPYGPANFSGQGVTTGGQYWRTDQFSASCSCWQVIDPNFQPSF